MGVPHWQSLPDLTRTAVVTGLLVLYFATAASTTIGINTPIKR